MATHRFREGDRASPVVARADLGAQYISSKQSEDGHAVLGPIYKRLLDGGILTPFAGTVAGPNPYGGNDEIKHYAAPQGLSSLAEYFIASAEVPVDYGTGLEDITIGQDGNVMVTVTGGQNISISPRSVVVLTQPVPQILGNSKFPVKGNFLQANAEVTAGLKKVEYSSRFATAYAFSNLSWPYDWTVQYFGKGDVRYVGNDSSRRGATDEASTSIVVHSGVPLGIELGDEQDPFPTAAGRLQADLEQKMPEIPWKEASSVKMHKWKYSQVYKGYAGARPSPDWTWPAEDSSCSSNFPGCVTVFQTEQALGLLAGDAFAPASKFDGCVFSAHRTAEAISSFFKK